MRQALAYYVQDLIKGYHPDFTLQLDSLTIKQGEILCLLGPTGSGKSTLLRLLGGIEPPDSGQLQCLNHNILSAGWPIDLQRQIAMVFQRPLMLRESVRANLEYGVRLRGEHHSKTSIVNHWLNRIYLDKQANLSARTLSGGQTQLLALARALILEPKILLLDEPTASLDPARVALVEELILEDQRQRETTIIWATHNLFQARRVAHRVCLLLGGRQIEIASREDFFESPKDERTRDFFEGRMIY